MNTFNTRCPVCKTINRIPNERISDQPRCGKCNHLLLDGKPIEGTSDNFNALLQSDVPVIVDFWAPWCNPCVGFAPVFEETALARSGRARFVKINTEEQTELAGQFGIRSIPTIMVFRHGERVNMINGALPSNQFNQWLDQSLN
jgi:thioredoxin 2